MKDFLKVVLVIGAILLGFGIVGKLFGIMWVVLKWAAVGAGLYLGYKAVSGGSNKKLNK